MFEFKLPDIGEGIHEAEIVEWKVAEGDRVTEGDSLVSVSTDKVDVELPSPRSGVVRQVSGQPGEVITVGTVLVRIDEATQSGAVAPESVAVAQTAAAPEAASPVAADGGNAPKRGTHLAPPVHVGSVRASPATRKFAAEHKMDLRKVRGSGVHGRVLRKDVEAFLAADNATEEAKPAAEIRRERLSGTRAVAAARLARSAHTLVTTTLSFEACADGLRYLLDQLKPEGERRGIKFTPLALIAKCAAEALRGNPRFNATIDEEANELVMYDGVDIGIAVAGASGLVVPIIRRVDENSVMDVARDIEDLANRSRAGSLEVSDIRGGSFTITSTGGLEKSLMVTTTPIINVPHVATLWVSRIADRPRVVDGELSAGPMMMCSLSFDHRYIDGAEGTAFINDLVALLESPARVLV